jgi:hypothetical protein
MSTLRDDNDERAKLEREAPETRIKLRTASLCQDHGHLGRRGRKRVLALIDEAIEHVRGDRTADASSTLARILMAYPVGHSIRAQIQWFITSLSGHPFQSERGHHEPNQ